MYYRKHQEIIGRVNPKFYLKRQSKNLPNFIIRNTNKINVQFYIGIVLSLRNLVGVQEETANSILVHDPF